MAARMFCGNHCFSELYARKLWRRFSEHLKRRAAYFRLIALDRLATFHTLLLFCCFRSQLDNRDSFTGLSSSVSYGQHHLILPSEKTEAWVQSRGETLTTDNWRCRQNLVIMQKISGCNRSLRWSFEVKVKTTKRNAALHAVNRFWENASFALELGAASHLMVYILGNRKHSRRTLFVRSSI